MTEPSQATSRGFFYALFSDENGVPDTADVAFLLCVIALVIGAVLIAFGHPFPLLQLGGAACALIPLYRLSRGDLRAPTAPAEKPPQP